MTEAHSFYATHSPFTDPGIHAPLFDALPSDPRLLTNIVQGLLFHYQEGNMYSYTVPEGGVAADEAHTVEALVTKLLKRYDAPLTQARPLPQRLVGCCRDYALLLTAMLRHHTKPARVRWGYARYFAPGFGHDHVVTETWDAEQERWVLIDAQQDALHIQTNRLTFDPHDLPRQAFPTAGEVWLGIRQGELDPSGYGYVPEHACGQWAVQHYLLADVAALNKVEVLHGDWWGLRDVGPENPTTPEDLERLDWAAQLSTQVETQFQALRELYGRSPGLRVPPVVQHTPLDHPGGPRTTTRLPLS